MSTTRPGLSLLSTPLGTDESVGMTLSLPMRLLLAALSGVLMFLPWLSDSLLWAGWIGWVPLLFALEGVSLRAAALLGWVAGITLYIGASNWMVAFAINLKGLSLPVSVLLAAVFWVYAGTVIGLACLAYRWLRQWLPGLDVVIFPLCIVSSIAIYPLLFETHFSEAQASFLPAVQGVALIGATGLDAVMTTTSVLVFLAIRRGLGPRRAYGRLASPLNMLAASMIAAWFIYGFASLNMWDERIARWDTRAIGLVQPNDAVTLDIPVPPEGFSHEFPEEMLATERLAEAGAEWVAWPEARYKGYFDKYSVRASYASRVTDLGISLIFHDVERQWQETEHVSYNSVAYLDSDGHRAGTYRKVQRMPFGEYLPEFFALPGIKTVSDLFLGEFLRPLGAGDEHIYFDIGDMQVVPKVCFETAFPTFVAESIGAEGAGKILLFLSQDNWFGETNQPFQHRQMSILRGVENRVPMVHLINNGPSVATDPAGRVVGATEAFTRAELLVQLPFSPEAGGSFFSRNPMLFSTVMFSALGLLILVAVVRAFYHRRHSARDQTTRPAL